SQQRIYRIMKTAAEQMTTGLFSLDAVSSKEDRITDIAIAFRALSSDNPQIFWLPSSYITSPDGSKLAFSYKNLDYTFTAEKKLRAEQKVNDVVGRLTAQAQKLNSDFEKELFFHNWLCENVSYSNDGTDDVYTVYGALINGVAVCEGYARAMQLLCDRVGIPCTVIYGFLNGIGHMWNIIDPGDGWYHLDVTCNDDEEFGYVRYAYFNFSDELISLDHTLFDAVVSGKSYIGADCFNIYLYNCNSEAYNYFIKKNLVFNDDINAAAQLILNAVSKGQTSIELLYMSSNKDYKYVLGQLNQALYNGGSSVFVKSYSPLGNSIVLRW
ncbi:MAG: transglutaminase domain-containing protein, partial [Acutalibacteraceae bacterium]